MSRSTDFIEFITSQPNGVQFLDPHSPEGKQFTDYLLTPTRMGKTGIVAGLICYDDVGSDFVKDALNDATFIVVNIYQRNLIGFACVRYYQDSPSEPTYYYIELICNYKPAPYELRSLQDLEDQRLGANAMITEIENKARIAGCEYVKLKAIEKVISYYARLGYMFPGVNTLEKLEEAKDLIQELRKAQVKATNEGMDPETDPAANKIYEEIAKKYYPGYFSEAFQQSLTQTDPELRVKEAVAKIKVDGIPMIKYLDEPPLPQPDLVEMSRPTFGGKRKTKKRRYKSKSKRNKRKSKARKQRKGKSKKSRKSKK